MARKNRAKSGSQPLAASELLEKAVAQPGVKSFLQVYHAWERIQGAFRPYSQFLQGTPRITVSNSSRPTNW